MSNKTFVAVIISLFAAFVVIFMSAYSDTNTTNTAQNGVLARFYSKESEESKSVINFNGTTSVSFDDESDNKNKSSSKTTTSGNQKTVKIENNSNTTTKKTSNNYKVIHINPTKPSTTAPKKVIVLPTDKNNTTTATTTKSEQTQLKVHWYYKSGDVIEQSGNYTVTVKKGNVVSQNMLTDKLVNTYGFKSASIVSGEALPLKAEKNEYSFQIEAFK